MFIHRDDQLHSMDMYINCPQDNRPTKGDSKRNKAFGKSQEIAIKHKAFCNGYFFGLSIHHVLMDTY